MRLAVEVPFGILKIIILPTRLVLPKFVEVLNFKHFEVEILKRRTPALTKVFLGVTSIFGIEFGVFVGCVLTELGSSFCSPLSISLDLVAVLLKVGPVILCLLEIRIVSELPIVKLLLLLLAKSLIILEVSFSVEASFIFVVLCICLLLLSRTCILISSLSLVLRTRLTG